MSGHVEKKRKVAARAGEPQVVNDASEWAALRPPSDSCGYSAFYSSATGAITTNPALMTVRIDDHAIVRGHACFDTASLYNGRLYRLQIHLRRLLDSAAAARIPLPYGPDEEVNRRRMTELVRATCAASGQSTSDVRFWLTAGTGNMGVDPTGCTSQFYILLFGGLPMPAHWMTDGVPEVSVPWSVVPPKPRMLAELKSNNYMLNSLTMMAAKDRGGTFGIGVDDDGFLTEACVLNVLLVGPDNVMRTPPFAHILKGTTSRRSLELAREHLVPSGVLAGVSQEKVALTDAHRAIEIILVAGDLHVYSCTSLDGHKIGTGKPGPVMLKLLELLKADAADGHADHEDL